MTVLIDLALAIVTFALFALACLGTGRALLAWADRRFKLKLAPIDLLGLGWIAGLGIVIFLAYGLLVAGVLNRWTAWAALAGGVVKTIAQRKPILAALRPAFSITRLRDILKRYPLAPMLLIPAAAMLYFGLIKSLLPINEWDAISSHFAYAKVWATEGLTSFDRISFLAYPKGIFALYAFILSLGFEPVLLLTSLAATFVACAMVGRITRGFSDNRYAGLIAATIYLSIPAIRFMTGTGKPYLPGTLFELSFLYLLLLTVDKHSPRMLFVLAGIFGGLAVGSVTNAVYSVTLMTTAVFAHQLWTRSFRLDALVLLAVTVGLVGCPSYVANFIVNGNPVYPLAAGVFGDNAWQALPEASPRLYNNPDLPLSARGFFLAWEHLLLDAPLTRGWAGGLGVAMAAGLVPVCAIWLKKRKLLLAMFAAGVINSIVWFLGVQVPRGLMIVMALLAVTAGLNLAPLVRPRAADLRRSIGSRTRNVLGAAVVAIVAAYAFLMIQQTSAASYKTLIIYAQVGRPARLAAMFRNRPQRPSPGRLEYETLQFLDGLPRGARVLAYPVFSGRFYVDTYLDVIPYQSPGGALLDDPDVDRAVATLRELKIDYVLYDKSFREEVKDDAWNDPAGGKLYRFSPLSPLIAAERDDVLELIYQSDHDAEYVYRVKADH